MKGGKFLDQLRTKSREAEKIWDPKPSMAVMARARSNLPDKQRAAK
jgi:hypothetical protein